MSALSRCLSVKLSARGGTWSDTGSGRGAGDEVQEVILRAIDKRITRWQEILGLSDRQMRRWRQRYEKFGYDGL